MDSIFHLLHYPTFSTVKENIHYGMVKDLNNGCPNKIDKKVLLDNCLVVDTVPFRMKRRTRQEEKPYDRVLSLAVLAEMEAFIQWLFNNTYATSVISWGKYPQQAAMRMMGISNSQTWDDKVKRERRASQLDLRKELSLLSPKFACFTELAMALDPTLAEETGSELIATVSMLDTFQFEGRFNFDVNDDDLARAPILRAVTAAIYDDEILDGFEYAYKLDFRNARHFPLPRGRRLLYMTIMRSLKKFGLYQMWKDNYMARTGIGATAFENRIQPIRNAARKMWDGHSRSLPLFWYLHLQKLTGAEYTVGPRKPFLVNVWHFNGSDLVILGALSLMERIRSSRGWTCQEQLLSRRFLIFTDGQVLWQCSSCFLCEDTEAANKLGSLAPLEQVDIVINPHLSVLPTSVFTEPLHLYRPKIFSQYSSIVSGFTKRFLTFTDDMLPAFQGFGSVLQRSFNCNFIAGLPEAYLDQALLWLPSVKQERRVTSSRDCPSWSWAGWIGQSRYETTTHDGRERVVPIVRWRVLERNGRVRKPNEIGIGIQEATVGLQRTANTFLWVPLFELLNGRLFSTPTIRHHLNSGPFLQFWSSCAFLRITARQSPPDQRAASRNPPLSALINSASSESGPYAGHLTLNGSGPLELEPHRHEFVVISEAQYAGFDAISSRYAPSDTCGMYNVMLVQWDQKRETAYRLGIGRVLKMAWNRAKPVVRFVTLG